LIAEIQGRLARARWQNDQTVPNALLTEIHGLCLGTPRSQERRVPNLQRGKGPQNLRLVFAGEYDWNEAFVGAARNCGGLRSIGGEGAW
jgi:hypothetical protein